MRTSDSINGTTIIDRTKASAMLVVLALTAQHAFSGPYEPAAGQPGSTAIIWNDASIVAWATGYQNYQVGANVDATWQAPQKTLGVAGNSNGSNQGFTYDIASLGNNGQITLTFAKPITDGPGADFLIFENSFNDVFLELAWVEVSSDGVNFFRYPDISFTASPVAGFGNVDPTNIDGYAGKYRGGYGAPFDLNVLENTPGLDIAAITHVKIIDIVGDGSARDIYPAVVGGPHVIYDPHPTTGSAGLDLDAVGVIHEAAVEPPYMPPNGPFPLDGNYKGSSVVDRSDRR